MTFIQRSKVSVPMSESDEKFQLAANEAEKQRTSTSDEASYEYVPEVVIPNHLTGEIQSKLAYVDPAIQKASVEPSRIFIEFSEPLNTSRISEISHKIQIVLLSMVKGAIRPKVQVLEDYLDRAVTYDQDPMDELLASGDVHMETAGIFSLGPKISRLVNFFEDQFLSLAESFDARPHRFPTLIPAKYLEKVNYFRAFPHSLTFATHLVEELENIDNFSKTASCDQHGRLVTSPASFSTVQALLSPAVCYHLYFSLADKTLPEGKLAATAVGNCFRYESINLASLERLWDFTMREIIFVGPKDFVLENRETAMNRMSAFFEEIGFAYRVESANDPFFIGEFRKQAAFQSAFQLKFEIRASLPFKQNNQSSSAPGTQSPGTLAVGSYNYHQDFFGRALNITLLDGSPAHTACVAFGLERIALAYLSQFGVDPSNWYPDIIKKF